VQVVPDLPTFAVDDGFPYRAPDALGEVGLGRIVRVPLGGRRVRGFVVDAAVPPAAVDTARLRDVLAISGDLAVFDERLLRVLRWAALHYVAPVAVLLAKAAPPNLPRRTDPAALPPLTPGPIPRHGPPRYRVNADPAAVAPAVAPYAAAGRSVVVVAPTAAEVDEIGDRLEAVLGPRVVRATSALGARRATAAWVRAATVPGTVLVGTREVAFWPLADPGLAVVVEEGRRAMKEPQSPGVHVRDLARTRGAVERFDVLFQGVVPTAEAIHGGVAVERPAGRAWPLVEIADRSEEPPGGGVIMDRTRRAVAGVVKAGGRAFVFVPRRGYAPAMRCVRCRTVRRCGVCGAGPGTGGGLPPLRIAGRGRVPGVGESASRPWVRVWAGWWRICAGPSATPPRGRVRRRRRGGDRARPGRTPRCRPGGGGRRRCPGPGTELPGRGDGAAHPRPGRRDRGPGGRGHRCIVQTAMADHPVMGALRRGDPLEFLGTVLEERAASGFPPTGQLIAVEVDPVPPGADEALRTAAGSAAVVHGPAPHGDGSRWLVQGGDLHGPRVRLRRVVQEWRDGGARVKVDADPIDL
jgi:primosomal protein N' (replication factor Y) (superfamily II helicase)